MGVLTCNRGDCNNIMCRRYSPKYGYICWECLEELKATQPASIEEFMDSLKGNRDKTPKVDYDKIFPGR